MGAIGLAIEPGRGRAGAPALPPAVFDFTAGTLPAGATLSRGSPAMRVDAAGALATAASNIARFDHDPVTLALRGLLIEPAATNKLLQSAALGATPWYSAAAMEMTGSGAAPDGSMTATRLTMTGAGIARHYQSYSPAGPDTLSLWLRGEAGGEAISFTALSNSSGLSGPSHTVVLTTTWVRHSFTVGIATNEYLLIGRNEANANNASATATASLYAWGAQAEAGTKATSHVPSGASSGTRDADLLALDWGSKGVADGTIMVRYTFDDLSMQDVAATVVGGFAPVPTTLTRPRLRRAERTA